MPKKKIKEAMKYKKAPMAPKRFKSAFMFYSAMRHQELRKDPANQKMKVSEMAKIVSQSWKALPDEERSQWQEVARLDRERFEREKAAYTGPWKVPNVKDPNYPKKPVSAFLAFSNERRKAVAAANPHLSGKELSSILSKLWKECPAETKQVYRDDEAQKREVYKQKVAEIHRQEKRGAVQGAAVYTDMAAVQGAVFNTDMGAAQGVAGNTSIPIASVSSQETSVFPSNMTTASESQSTTSALGGFMAASAVSSRNSTNHAYGTTDPPFNHSQEHPTPAGMEMFGVNNGSAGYWPLSLEPRRVAFGMGNKPIGFENPVNPLAAVRRPPTGREGVMSMPDPPSGSASLKRQYDDLSTADFMKKFCS